MEVYSGIQKVDMIHYTKLSALCVHMILHEKYSGKNTNFGGMDKGVLTP